MHFSFDASRQNSPIGKYFRTFLTFSSKKRLNRHLFSQIFLLRCVELEIKFVILQAVQGRNPGLTKKHQLLFRVKPKMRRKH